ncbi:hypothetical protein TNCV_1777031 [Trichonephila clavipes]|nr:hypothetical protein TNCV_1777031 [Trichonephila clavipes]
MTTEHPQMKTRCSILWLQLNPNRKRKDSFLVFPATASELPEAVDQLKERFRKEDLLVPNLCSGSSDNGYEECCVR